MEITWTDAVEEACYCPQSSGSWLWCSKNLSVVSQCDQEGLQHKRMLLLALGFSQSDRQEPWFCHNLSQSDPAWHILEIQTMEHEELSLCFQKEHGGGGWMGKLYLVGPMHPWAGSLCPQVMQQLGLDRLGSAAHHSSLVLLPPTHLLHADKQDAPAPQSSTLGSPLWLVPIPFPHCNLLPELLSQFCCLLFPVFSSFLSLWPFFLLMATSWFWWVLHSLPGFQIPCLFC